MINLLSDEQKRDIKAARINVMLIRYSITLLLLGLLIAAVYGTGYWILSQEDASIDEKLASQSEKTKAFAEVEKSADQFRDNLKVAKAILDHETSYSTFLITLAGDIPAETILTNISLGSSTTTVGAKDPGLEIAARASSYEKILALKNSLEQSELFEDVNIVSATAPTSTDTLKGVEARYPFTTTLNAKLQPAKGTTR